MTYSRKRLLLWAGAALILGGGALAQTVIKANQGAAGNQGAWPVSVSNTTSTPFIVRLEDGTGTTLGTVIAASTAATSTATSLVVQLSPNNPSTAVVNTNPTASGATLTEVLVLNSASTLVPTTSATGRRSIEIQNLGPNPIYCNPTTTAVLTKSRRIDSLTAWAVDIGSGAAVQCRAATADQVTGAATVVTELTVP